ncbi:MAG: DUF2490 domain-containing protein [Flavobacteriales bacterium]|nr:DUF2490 domain-containing protein [Flavobacteriales bacterium]
MRRTERLLFAPLMLFALAVQGQGTDQQSWNDLVIRKRVSPRTLLESELSYRVLLDVAQDWWSLNWTPAMVWTATRHWDLIPRYSLRYTVQGYNTVTWENRAQFGTRIHFTPEHRVRLRALIRNEQRFFTVVSPERSTSYSSRTRFRAEMVMSVRANDDRWYVLADFEAFVVLSEPLNERFSDRNRWRAGTGYRFTPHMIGEFNYGYQRSVNELDPRGYIDDGIIRFRFIYFLTPRARTTEPEEEEVMD